MQSPIDSISASPIPRVVTGAPSRIPLGLKTVEGLCRTALRFYAYANRVSKLVDKPCFGAQTRSLYVDDHQMVIRRLSAAAILV